MLERITSGAVWNQVQEIGAVNNAYEICCGSKKDTPPAAGSKLGESLNLGLSHAREGRTGLNAIECLQSVKNPDTTSPS
jgi:hypothetical protein